MPYSTRFFASQYSSGATLAYTVPAGYLAVIRDLECLNLYDGSNVFALYVGIPGPTTVQFGNWTMAAFGDVFQWKGRVVLNAGDTVSVVSAQDSLQAFGTGYLFSAT